MNWDDSPFSIWRNANLKSKAFHLVKYLHPDSWTWISSTLRTGMLLRCIVLFSVAMSTIIHITPVWNWDSWGWFKRLMVQLCQLCHFTKSFFKSISKIKWYNMSRGFNMRKGRVYLELIWWCCTLTMLLMTTDHSMISNSF